MKQVFILHCSSKLSFNFDVSMIYQPNKYELHLIVNTSSYDLITLNQQDKFYKSVLITDIFTVATLTEYIKSNMNVSNGILVDVNHVEIFKYLDDILRKDRIENNLKFLERFSNKITKTKRTKDNTFKLKDVEKLEIRLNGIKESMNRNNVDINTFMFQYKYTEKNISINLNQVKEKVKDCIEFIEKENKFLS